MLKPEDFTRRTFLNLSAGAMVSSWLGEAFAQTRPDLSSIKNRADWQRARRQILDGMQLVMGTLESRHDKLTNFPFRPGAMV